MPSPLLEAAYLLQAFVAALEALQIQTLLVYGYVRGVYSFVVHSVGPFLGLLLLFTILVQIKTPSPSRQQTLRFELVKSTIVSILWVWFLVSTIVGWWDPYFNIANIILSFLFISVVFYSTLWVSLRKERNAGAAVRGEAQSLLPH
ncbi:hypothetical protein N431DRAFT_379335 [Stipitochalara longipes BDJ]|nr:hypothetical protein N431DRAFT_379335 [Stipitochalara longipes BDJ]